MEKNFHTITATKEVLKKLHFIVGKNKEWRKFLKKTEKEQFDFMFEFQTLVTKSIVWGMKQGYEPMSIPYICSFSRRLYKEQILNNSLEEQFETTQELKQTMAIRMKNIRELKQKYGEEWENYYVSTVDLPKEIALAEEKYAQTAERYLSLNTITK